MNEKSIDGWLTVFTTGTDYEGEIVRDRLVDSGISAVVLTHRDHAFNLTVGDMATVRVLVPPTQRDEAVRILRSVPFSPAELDAAALAANPELGSDESVIDEDDSAFGDDGYIPGRFDSESGSGDASDESGDRS